MYKIDIQTPLPENSLVVRKGKHHDIMAHCAALKPGESFEADIPPKELKRAIRALHWFKRKHGLRLFIEQWGEESLRVWCLQKD